MITYVIINRHMNLNKFYIHVDENVNGKGRKRVFSRNGIGK